ncbi:hypothetical protein, partial [Kineococcus indalonis]|uniref:hypothetical protein n=1 Tax=Kineococcus indalonis TaxID=2696566 RepID=UPI00196A6236
GGAAAVEPSRETFSTGGSSAPETPLPLAVDGVLNASSVFVAVNSARLVRYRVPARRGPGGAARAPP